MEQQRPKTRRACDRCHTQKLRCRRDETIGATKACMRCTRDNLDCVYSPPKNSQKQNAGLPASRRSTVASPYQQPVESVQYGREDGTPSGKEDDVLTSSWPLMPELRNSTGLGLDPYDLDALSDPVDLAFELNAVTGSLSPGIPPGMVQLSPVGRHSAATPSLGLSADDKPIPNLHLQARGQNTEDWIGQISDINLRLLNHASYISSLEAQALLERSDPIEQGFGIDQTFLLSQQLLDLLSVRSIDRLGRLTRHASTCAMDVPPELVLSGSQSSSTSSSSYMAPSPHSPLRNLDLATTILILSCHLRVLNIYAKTFHHLERCIQERRAPEDIHLPGMTFGAFSLHSSSSLQITLMIQLAETLLGRLHDTVSAVNYPPGPVNGPDSHRPLSDPWDEVSDSILQALKASHRDMMQTETALHHRRSTVAHEALGTPLHRVASALHTSMRSPSGLFPDLSGLPAADTAPIDANVRFCA
ncbi:hypothetical protein BO70DRAFT_399638 [Aspergillus heteromorphus CBS 117.55]|uniref:Zn(2)-C6 fungal-type domain-containing protein n=1 Tax=Aspergillus heteromorphus CBS 117.55 TaxID=1448321 RepID=A0A317V9F5_9EURO|nr:uncharacterized protein BO70DRAFT_399638 [Aspergillus heteromorphus CBS 117.55]PWY71023.1 hypothetical protein BO70DRAFT_399638 [Aspergillus heteromorphus CBS 117.55]